MTTLLEQVKHPIDDMVDFVMPYFPKFSEDNVREIIHTHWLYGTVDAVYRDGKIIACVRWNISQGGIIVDVLDLFIQKGENGVLLMKHLIARNWHRFPSARIIRFARVRKYPGRLAKIYSIHLLLHLKESPYERK